MDQKTCSLIAVLLLLTVFIWLSGPLFQSLTQSPAKQMTADLLGDGKTLAMAMEEYRIDQRSTFSAGAYPTSIEDLVQNHTLTREEAARILQGRSLAFHVPPADPTAKFSVLVLSDWTLGKEVRVTVGGGVKIASINKEPESF